VLFSEESRTQLSCANGQTRVWRRRNERYRDTSTIVGGGSLHFWAGVTQFQRPPFLIFDRNVITNVYINNVLRSVAIPIFTDTFLIRWYSTVWCCSASSKNFYVKKSKQVIMWNWWKGKPLENIACTRKQQLRFYWSCSSVVMNDATPLTPPSALCLDSVANVQSYRLVQLYV